MKLFFLTLLFIFLSGCFHETSLIRNYGQSIVKFPNQTDAIDDINTGKNVNMRNVSLSNKDINYTNKFENIDFSSSKFLKGNPNCISLIRVSVLGSISYDELMYELRKRAKTMGGNAIGIQNLNENKEVTYTNQRTAKKNSKEVINNLIKETNLLSSVTADIFKCNPTI